MSWKPYLGSSGWSAVWSPTRHLDVLRHAAPGREVEASGQAPEDNLEVLKHAVQG